MEGENQAGELPISSNMTKEKDRRPKDFKSMTIGKIVEELQGKPINIAKISLISTGKDEAIFKISYVPEYIGSPQKSTPESTQPSIPVGELTGSALKIYNERNKYLEDITPMELLVLEARFSFNKDKLHKKSYLSTFLYPAIDELAKNVPLNEENDFVNFLLPMVDGYARFSVMEKHVHDGDDMTAIENKIRAQINEQIKRSNIETENPESMYKKIHISNDYVKTYIRNFLVDHKGNETQNKYSRILLGALKEYAFEYGKRY